MWKNWVCGDDYGVFDCEGRGELGLVGEAVAEFFDAEEEIADAELGVDEAEVAVDHFGAVIRYVEHRLDLEVFGFDVELFEDFEPEEMHDGDAQRFFHAVGGVDDILVVDGLEQVGDCLADFGRDDCEVNAVGRPEGEVLGAGFGAGRVLVFFVSWVGVCGLEAIRARCVFCAVVDIVECSRFVVLP